ncbi:ornithine decarboxylase-like isoform X1 [Dreissena polymorpha]|uniref:ornithine decarboxylase n=2 Tax=Dreissena polymorpha TaxID=45954 RepID=A0A9D3YCR9_DREPO|nr:ornithine decarboxylase-like isoform X1 [Dreissena polymorpha]KAH3696032.1 hypothetical protein DPMN_083494 [Dreissena polymorpha]
MKQYLGNQAVDIHQSGHSTHSIIETHVAHAKLEGGDESLIIGNLGDIVHKYNNWVRKIPRVKPFYAVKCNDDSAVLQILADLGANFDCASKAEIQKVLSMGVCPSRIIYANPCKQSSMIRFAAKANVEMMTFDNESELHKVKSLFPTAKLVLRILPPSNFKVQCELGIKFGVNPAKAIHLLRAAKSLDLDVMGVSFHVGSGCQEPEAFVAAIQQARMVFDQGLDLGFNMTLLDIGGGFPGHAGSFIAFDAISQVVNMALDKYFPAEEGVTLIAEPGRYMVASAFTLAVNVIAKRVVARDQNGSTEELNGEPSVSDQPAVMYYVSDGVYGSFNCLLYDHAEVNIKPLKYVDVDDMTFESSVWGPTCDGMDCILKNVQLPMHEVGEWFYFENMGAYTIAAASTFNGMQNPTRFYYCDADIWFDVYPEAVTGYHSAQHGLPFLRAGHSLHDTFETASEMFGESNGIMCNY